jgi:hypothetical protein
MTLFHAEPLPSGATLLAAGSPTEVESDEGRGTTMALSPLLSGRRRSSGRVDRVPDGSAVIFRTNRNGPLNYEIDSPFIRHYSGVLLSASGAGSVNYDCADILSSSLNLCVLSSLRRRIGKTERASTNI